MSSLADRDAMVRARALKARKAVPRKKAVRPVRLNAVVPSRAVPRLVGKGAYSYSNPGPWGKAGRFIGGALGGAYGGAGGAKLGSAVGGLAHYIGRIFGSGDYVMSPNPVKYNVLVNESQVPQFGSMPNTVHIRHREYIGDVVTSNVAGAFRIQDFPINPGMGVTFPWLSQVCGATFQQHRINGMVFEFRTMSSDALNSTNTALGSVVMATEYDSLGTPFVNKFEMENTEFGVSCKPSCNMMHAIECDRRQTTVSELYIRNAAPPATADRRLYDLGRFSIATTGFQGTNVNIGELWVTYDITLFKAILEPPLSIGLFTRFHIDVATGLAGGISNHPMALLPQTSSPPGIEYDNIGLTVNTTGTVVTFPLNIPSGTTFAVFYSLLGNVNVAAAMGTITGAGGLVGLNILAANTASTAFWPNAGPGANGIGRYSIFRYDGSGTPAVPPTLTWSVLAAPAAPTSGDCLVIQIPSSSPI